MWFLSRSSRQCQKGSVRTCSPERWVWWTRSCCFIKPAGPSFPTLQTKLRVCGSAGFQRNAAPLVSAPVLLPLTVFLAPPLICPSSPPSLGLSDCYGGLDFLRCNTTELLLVRVVSRQLSSWSCCPGRLCLQVHREDSHRRASEVADTVLARVAPLWKTEGRQLSSSPALIERGAVRAEDSWGSWKMQSTNTSVLLWQLGARRAWRTGLWGDRVGGERVGGRARD